MPSKPIGRQAVDASGLALRLVGDVVLSCTGELDSTTVPALHRSLELLLALGPARVVVDLSGVTFLDAGAIGELAGARTKRRAAGGDLVLRAPSEFGRRVLDIVGESALIADTGPDAHRRPFDIDAFGRELVATWEAACAADLYGASPLVYDPTRMISAVLEELHDPLDEAPPTALVADAVRRDGASGALAVMQLWALGDVLRASTTVAPGYEHEGRVRRHLGAALAETAAAALAELEQTSLLDPLTGLLNRRALDRDLVRWVAAARRHAEPLSVVMIDIEGLKATNDHLGHAAGDDTLRGLAASLTGALRSEDNAYRIGGDEFVLVLPRLGPVDVEGVMARAAADAPAAFTWGCAWIASDEGPPSDAHRAAELLEQADRRMLELRARVRAGGIDALASPGELTGRFTEANRSSVLIDGARGAIAEHFGVDIDAASVMLSTFATTRGQSIADTAADLMARTVALADLSPRAPSVRS